MKKILAMLLALVMVLSLAACSVEKAPEETKAPETQAPAANNDPVETEPAGPAPVEISLWTYPIGGWGNDATVQELIAAFNAEYPHITVKVEYLDYSTGDDKVNTAIEGGAAPDLIMEGPERLVANWGEKGLMVDLSGLLDDTDLAELNPAAIAACYATNGEVYEYPLVMTAHCMAINKTVFEAAGALQYLNAETHTWNSVEDFYAAIDAVYAYTGKQVGAVFCGGQGGDQGTRALVNNLNGGTFTNAEHTAYTWNSAENIAALTDLYNCEGIAYDAGIVGGDEIALFYQGVLDVAFCWNIAQQLDPNGAGTGSEKTMTGDDILFMAFPSDATPELCGGIWGFGIFDNGNDAKIEAAKTFIKYMTDSAATAEAVKAANYFAVRNTAEGVDLSGIWADNAIMQEYNKLMPMLGDYYQVTSGWAAARTAWWNMLQAVGNGEDVATAVEYWAEQANAAAAG